MGRMSGGSRLPEGPFSDPAPASRVPFPSENHGSAANTVVYCRNFGGGCNVTTFGRLPGDPVGRPGLDLHIGPAHHAAHLRHRTAAGAPALDLTAADFQIVENGTKREVDARGARQGADALVLLVDSSWAIPQMLNHFRAGLNAFFDTLPPEHEVVFITTGGQTRIRVPPTTDRAALKTAAGRFAADSGANSFLETLLESDGASSGR